MKPLIIIALLFSSLSFASDLSLEEKKFAIKETHNFQAYLLKLEKEQQLLELKNQDQMELLEFSSLRNRPGYNNECVDWVYIGPHSREEAYQACRGVRDMECVKWVYIGPGSRLDAAVACKRVRNLECPKWVYQGPGSRIDAASSCSGVRSMECVKDLYGSTSKNRRESAQACGDGGAC